MTYKNILIYFVTPKENSDLRMYFIPFGWFRTENAFLPCTACCLRSLQQCH